MSEYVYGKCIRKIYSGGDSLVVTIPSEFLENHNLESGDKVELLYGEVLQLQPIRAEDIEKDMKDKGDYENERGNKGR